MAERRMFAKTIVTSDAFLDMPPTARCLYFTLGMFADDDGFVNNPKSIMRQTGATADDMNILIGKKFVLAFESGVIVIKHWRIHNYIQNDRYHETKYKDELDTLTLDENNAYTLVNADVPLLDTECIHDVSIVDTEDRIGKSKDRLSKDRLSKDNNKRFVKPTIEEIEDYINEKGYQVDAHKFYDYYESNGWRVGRNPMKDWRAAIRNWAHNGYNKGNKKQDGFDAFADLLKGGMFE